MAPPRIYADFNHVWHSPRNPERRAVALDTLGTANDLEKAGLVLYDGLQLVIYDHSDETEDLEADAIVYYDAEYNNTWFAEFDRGGIRDVPRS